MRIDEINLLGQFKITGNTGNNSQAIGMSGGSTSFIDVVAGGGSSAGLVQRSGYNYVIVEATSDALANGVKLQTAYSDAKLLDVGTKSVDNRVTILLTPGYYDIGPTYINLDTSYIDIIGISRNPLDTIIISSSDILYTLYYGTNVDAILENLYILRPVPGNGTTLGGDSTSYVRAKNLVLGDNAFCVGGSIFGFSNLNGEFESIKIIEEAENLYPFYVSGDINGRFKNITIETANTVYGFYAGGNLSGTFSNITIGYNGNVFSCGGSLSGTFENINIGYSTGGSVFGSTTNILGYYRNIKVSGSPNTFFYTSGSMSGIFEDIETSGVGTSTFYADGDISSVVCKNIKIGDFTGSAFYGNNVYGTYSNIEIGNAPIGSAFQSASDLSASLKDVTLGNVGIAFQSGINITGTYENITIGDVGGDCFVSTTDIIGTFKNIKVGNIGTSFFIPNNDLNGTYENITVGDVTTSTFYAVNSIMGTYKNILVKSVGANFFYTDNSNIDGIFDRIYIGYSGDFAFYSSSSTLTGTFSNIEILNCVRSFGSADTSGYYDGITIGTSSNNTFSGISTGTYKNIKINSCYSFFASGLSIQPTLVENIEVGECTVGSFIETNIGSLGGTYKNIKVGSITGNAFSADLGITGTYSNIEVGSCTGDMFYGGTNISNIIVNVDNLFVGTVSTIFDPGPAAVVSAGSKFNKLDVTGNCFGYALRSKSFVAKLTNSRINMIGRNDAMFLAGGQIERCKILTDASTMSGSGQVIYTMTNQSNTVTGATQCISDTSITS